MSCPAHIEATKKRVLQTEEKLAEAIRRGFDAKKAWMEEQKKRRQAEAK